MKMDNTPETEPLSLSLGTRIVLETPQPGGGYACETPSLAEFARALAPLLVPFLTEMAAAPDCSSAGQGAGYEDRYVLTDHGASILNAPASEAPTCDKCGGAKTPNSRGRYLCRPCMKQAVSDGHARARSRGFLPVNSKSTPRTQEAR